MQTDAAKHARRRFGVAAVSVLVSDLQRRRFDIGVPDARLWLRSRQPAVQEAIIAHVWVVCTILPLVARELRSAGLTIVKYVAM